jgi:transposase-like protein
VKPLRKETYTLLEWQQRFNSEAACLQKLAETRWPNGFQCNNCGSKKVWYTPGHELYRCASCLKRTSIKAGTIFHATKLPLTYWFLAIYFCSVDKGGISAIRLATYLDVSWNTARFMLLKIRSVMGERDQEYLLSGIIELDDAFVGGKSTGGKRGRGSEKKTPILVACENREKEGRAGYLKMRVVPKIDEQHVKAFSAASITPQQCLKIDGSPTLRTLKNEHQVTHQVVPPHESCQWLPWVHVAIANLKRFLLGTYHGVSGARLQEYLDEFCYRFNRRWCELEIPMRLLTICLIHKPILRTSF